MSDTAGFAYQAAAVDLALARLDWKNGDMRVVLVSEKYQPRQSQDRSIEDLRGAEVTDPVKVMGRRVDEERAGRVCLQASGVRWPSFSGEFRYAVVFNADTGRLVAYSDLGPQKVTNTVPVLDYPDGDVCEFIID